MDDKPRRRETQKELEQRLGIYPSWWVRNSEMLLIGLAIPAIVLVGAVALLQHWPC